MRQNSTNSNKKWKHSWLKGLLVNGSILLPTFLMYACKSKGEFAIRSGPTLGLTPCTPLWLGQYTSTLLSQLWLWFRSFNFSVLKFITAINCWFLALVLRFFFRSSGPLVFHPQQLPLLQKLFQLDQEIKEASFVFLRLFTSHLQTTVSVTCKSIGSYMYNQYHLIVTLHWNSHNLRLVSNNISFWSL